ncbi:hypothetical protein SBOR_6633 [Sclerotinia borealis F-4128]|uniref:Pentatricopeptide repeat protein n=1 Tax=Sclerotinia borealis (strain F-4128) TaxID=1432307 RepID=W9C898_SCLBF|nr:hypothetical protein SBOR_6633 [Sclerotinia borealis F-4128]
MGFDIVKWRIDGLIREVEEGEFRTRFDNAKSGSSANPCRSAPGTKKYQKGERLEGNSSFIRQNNVYMQSMHKERQLYRSFASNATDSGNQSYQPISLDEESLEPTKSKGVKRQEWLDSRGQRPADKKPAPIDPNIDDKFIWKLKQLQDPLQLASYVRKLLSDDDFEKALLYVRAASKNVECVVSWNHLIEWQFSKDQLTPALKTYNEMKKRAQYPDAQTYTIIFKGCSDSPYTKQAFEKGLAIYTSMLSVGSRLKPNTIHMNAVLRLCSRAGEEEALLGIAAQMPAEGARAPDNLTFTTILNAFRMKLLGNTNMPEKELLKLKRKTIDSAHRMWGDIFMRWRKGDIMVDEELVCAMGRTLLHGSEEDNDDILSLVEQTMNVRRQMPRRGTKSRQQIEPSLQGQSISEDKKGLVEVEDGGGLNPRGQLEDIFASSGPAVASLPRSHVFATPGPNTISMILKALLNLGKKEPATKYWNIFVKERGIVPDQDNYHRYMRILRLCRSSREVLELLLEIPKESLKHEFFRLAMSTCERDKNNPNVFATAGKILDIMQMNLEVPDIIALVTYMDVSMSSSLTRKASGNRPTKFEQGKQILRALDRVGPSYLNIRALVMYGNPTATDYDRFQDRDFKDSVLVLIRRIIGAYDVLMDKGLVARDAYGDVIARRNKLTAYEARVTAPHAGTRKYTKGYQYEHEPEDEEPEPTPKHEHVDRSTHEFSKKQFRTAVKGGFAPLAATQGYVARVQPFASRKSNTGAPASFANRKPNTVTPTSSF